MKTCPTCGGDCRLEIINGKCKACRLGVIQDWNKCKETHPVEGYRCFRGTAHKGLHQFIVDGVQSVSW